jgi:outer membrane protein assembly factor BamB
MKRIVLGLAALMLLVGGCSTISKVGKIIPFVGGDDEKKKAKQGVLPDEEQRISILTFEQSLQVDENAEKTPMVLPPAYVNADWAQSGAFPSHAPQHLSAKGGLQKVWKKSIGKSSYTKGRIVAPPVIAGGTLYVLDAKGTVRAIDTKSGSTKWRKTIVPERKVLPKEDRRGRFGAGWRGVFRLSLFGAGREGYGGGLAVSGGRLFLVSGHGLAAALDVNTGEMIWRTETPTPIHSSPSLADGRMFAVTQDDELYAFDTQTGDVLWTYQGITEPARILAASSPAVYGEIVVSPFASGELTALRVQNGRNMWSESLTRQAGLTALAELNDIAGAPVIFDRTVYAISHSGLLAAVDMRTGTRIWSRQVGGINMPWLAGDNLFVVTNEGQVSALSRHNGRVLWVRDLPRYRKEKKRKGRISWAGPVLAGDKLILVSSRGKVLQLSPQTGETLAEKKFGDAFFVTPVVADEYIYLLSDSANLYKLQ